MIDPGPDGLAVAAPAKINLYLHVTGRRDDGYHLLDSLIVFAGIQDSVLLRPAADLSLAVEGPFADAVPTGPDNLVLAAAGALARAAGIERGAAITLIKRLPAGAGMGGGSADAAATLRGLFRLWDVAAADADLAEIAASLGADVPMCLAGKAAFAGGIGGDLTPAPPLPAVWLVLVNPGIPLATPAVFAARAGDFSTAARFDEAAADTAALAAMLASRRNDLTAAATSQVPLIADVLAALDATPGAKLARMTGSGATCFALFADADGATRAAQDLARRHPDWWCQAAPLETDILDREA